MGPKLNSAPYAFKLKTVQTDLEHDFTLNQKHSSAFRLLVSLCVSDTFFTYLSGSSFSKSLSEQSYISCFHAQAEENVQKVA